MIFLIHSLLPLFSAHSALLPSATPRRDELESQQREVQALKTRLGANTTQHFRPPTFGGALADATPLPSAADVIAQLKDDRITRLQQELQHTQQLLVTARQAESIALTEFNEVKQHSDNLQAALEEQHQQNASVFAKFERIKERLKVELARNKSLTDAYLKLRDKHLPTPGSGIKNMSTGLVTRKREAAEMETAAAATTEINYDAAGLDRQENLHDKTTASSRKQQKVGTTTIEDPPLANIAINIAATTSSLHSPLKEDDDDDASVLPATCPIDTLPSILDDDNNNSNNNNSSEKQEGIQRVFLHQSLPSPAALIAVESLVVEKQCHKDKKVLQPLDLEQKQEQQHHQQQWDALLKKALPLGKTSTWRQIQRKVEPAKRVDLDFDDDFYLFDEPGAGGGASNITRGNNNGSGSVKSSAQVANNNNNNDANGDNDKVKPYKYQEVIRRKDEREKLTAFECEACRRFWEAIDTWGAIPQQPGTHAMASSSSSSMKCGHSRLPPNATAEEAKVKAAIYVEGLKQNSGRHRYRYEPPSTPKEFWNMNFTPVETSPPVGKLPPPQQQQQQQQHQ